MTKISRINTVILLVSFLCHSAIANNDRTPVGAPLSLVQRAANLMLVLPLDTWDENEMKTVFRFLLDVCKEQREDLLNWVFNSGSLAPLPLLFQSIRQKHSTFALELLGYCMRDRLDFIYASFLATDAEFAAMICNRYYADIPQNLPLVQDDPFAPAAGYPVLNANLGLPEMAPGHLMD